MATVYGDNDVLDDLRVQLKSLLDAMKTDMDAAATDPRPGAIYNDHEQPYMTLPAISIGVEAVEAAEGTGITSGSAYNLIRHVVCQLRVHIDYDGGYADYEKCWQLINSVSNYIEQKAHLYLQANLSEYLSLHFGITEMGVDESFDETGTIGGYYKFGIIIKLQHTPS